MKSSSSEKDFSTNIQSLKQYKLDSNESNLSDSSDLEVCVDSIILPDPEDLCIQLLLNKYRKQHFFILWKFKTISNLPLELSNEEISGIKAQTENSTQLIIKSKRKEFLIKYSTLAFSTLNKLKLSRLFGKWIEKFSISRLSKVQINISDIIQRKKILQKTFHPMRKEIISKLSNSLDNSTKSLLQLSPKNKTEDLINELNRLTKENNDLENLISNKSENLKELQNKIQELTFEESDNEKKIIEINNNTNKLQLLISETEKQYQEEIANLKTQLTLSEKEGEENILKLSEELNKQNAERKATNDFVDDAQIVAKNELLFYKDKLLQAEKVVQEFKDILIQSENKTQKLENNKQLLNAELENLKLKKKQLELSIQSEKSSIFEKEEKMKRMLENIQQELHIAVGKIQAQEAQIQNKKKKIQLLKEDIERNRLKTTEVQNKFLKGFSNF